MRDYSFPDWNKELSSILGKYKDGIKDPLNENEVDDLVDIIKAKINYMEGNITLLEYKALIEYKGQS